MVQLTGRLALCLLLLFTLGVATPRADESKRYYQGLEKLKREKPVEYENQRRMFTLVTQMLLGRIGYDVGPFDGQLGRRTRSALGLYQEKRGLPVTLDPLSFETNKQISADFAALEQHTVVLPKLLISTDAWDDGYVFAEGTWAVSGEDMVWPEQTSKINCIRDLGICLEATATIESSAPGIGEWHLALELHTYQIERWNAVELVTKPRHQATVRPARPALPPLAESGDGHPGPCLKGRKVRGHGHAGYGAG